MEHREDLARTLQQHLSCMPIGPVTVRPTPASGRQMSDIDVFVSGMFVGVGVVCDAAEPYTSMSIPAERLNQLRKDFFTAGRWTKTVVLLAMLVDGTRLIDMQSLIQNRNKTQRTEDGRVVIPYELTVLVA